MRYKKDKQKEDYTDFAVVESMRNEIIPEDLPEGAYGSPINRRLGKSTPFEEDQQAISNFTYENRQHHEDLPRQYPGAHPTHDEEDKDTEKPYNDVQ